MAIKTDPQPRPGTPIGNRNFLSPIGFKFSLKRTPGVAYFCNEANIPDMSLSIAEQPTYLRDLPLPGDKIDFGDLSLRFLVDEDLTNYMEIQNWIRGLGYPESISQYAGLEEKAYIKQTFGQKRQDIYSDGTLQILSNNLVPKFQVLFDDLFPYSLSTVTFDATDTDIEYFTAEVSFKYTIYRITNLEGKAL